MINRLSSSQQPLYHAILFRGRQQNRGTPIFSLVASMLLLFAATLIQLGISRSRESFADESAAKIIKDPISLANALEKLHADSRVTKIKKDLVNASTASLFIVHPFSAKGMMSLLSTRPPMDDRVARLHKMARDMRNNS